MKKIFYNLDELIAGFFLIITVTSVVLYGLFILEQLLVTKEKCT